MYAGIFLAAVTAAAVAIIVIQVQNHRQQREQREALTSGRGWEHVEPAPDALWSSRGEARGLKWKVRAIKKQTRSGSHSSSMRRTIFTASVPTDAVVMTGPKFPTFLRERGLSGGLVQEALSKLVGEEGAQLLAKSHFIEVGSSFDEDFDVLTSEDERARALLTTKIQRALSEQHERQPTPVVMWWQDELVIRVDEVLFDPSDYVAFVDMCLVVLEEAAAED